MKILVLGDVCGDSGLQAIVENIPKIKKKYQVDFVIVNSENAANMFGITKKEYDIIKQAGADIITLGNHTFDKLKGVLEIIDKKDLLLPANWNPHYLKGKGTVVVEVNNKKIRVTNLMGRSFMPCHVNNPFEYLDEIIAKNDSDIHIIDFHAESCAEKYAIGVNYDGKVTALLGTHTHVQTSDNKLLPKGTAYITDIGMNGPYHSVIGVAAEESIYIHKVGIRTRLVAAEGPYQFCGVVVEIDDKTNKATGIKRLYIAPGVNYLEE